MAKRSSYGQRKHNVEVRRTANSLRRKAWDVKADIKGFERPGPIGSKGKIPDVVAEKSGAKKIVEVETPETMSKDRKQHETFRRSAAQEKRTSFEIKEV